MDRSCKADKGSGNMKAVLRRVSSGKKERNCFHELRPARDFCRSRETFTTAIVWLDLHL
jgi:hypothetical protein